MRISPEIAVFLKETIVASHPEAEVYLFGSRKDDTARGGDIDILILTNALMTFDEMSKIRIQFMKNFGEQKLDLVNFTFSEDKPFKRVALEEAVKL